VGVGKAQALLTQTILDVLNAEADSLSAPRVYRRTLEDWISEKLLAGPLQKSLGRQGSEWTYTPASLKAALEVIKFKAVDPHRRNSVLRIRLWLLGFDISIKQIAEDLDAEFRRLLRRNMVRNPLHYDAKSGGGISVSDKDRERRRAGTLDSAFIDAGFELPRDDLLRLVWEAISDPARSSQFLEVLDQLVSPLLSESGKMFFQNFLRSVEPYIDTSGLLGNPDEIETSGLVAIAAVNKACLIKGRSLYQFAVSMADCAGRGEEFFPPDLSLQLGDAFSKTARSLRDSDEWCVAGLAVCTIAASRASRTAVGTRPFPGSD
jgi:hypothetical protein